MPSSGWKSGWDDKARIKLRIIELDARDGSSSGGAVAADPLTRI